MTPLLHLESMGRGPDLCLLHGWGTHGGVWKNMAEKLSREFTVHRIDLPGHGNSRMIDVFSLDDTVGRLKAALDAAGLERVTIVGWSLGGLLGIKLALDLPQRVRRLAVFSTTPCFVKTSEWSCAMDETVLDAFQTDLSKKFADTIHRFLALQAQGDERAKENIRQLRSMVLDRGEANPRALAGALDVLKKTDLRNRLAELRQDVLWFGGQRDVLVPPPAIEWAANQCSNINSVIVKAAGHAPFLSHSDTVMPLLTEFLNHEQP